jgi:hypothetical protein
MSHGREESPEVSQEEWFPFFLKRREGGSKRKKLFDRRGNEKAWETQKLKRAEALT